MYIIGTETKEKAMHPTKETHRHQSKERYRDYNMSTKEIARRFENTLFLEMRGCNFFEGDEINNFSDVGNYRVGSYDYSILGKDGISYILEFTNYDKRNYRRTNKRTGAPLKKEVVEIVKKHALHIDTQYECTTGCYRNSRLEHNIHELLYSYTLNDILTVVNKISVKQYDRIILLWDEKIKDKLDYIYNLGGYREKQIIANLDRVDKKQYDKDYYVLTFTARNGDSFDYEMNSNRITN